jgi:outer membrane murein-binding lipoprotein Lpp
MATQLRKIDELAETLSDLSTTVDELRDNPEGIDEDKLSEIKAALDRAIAAVDDIENQNAE